MSGVEQGRQRRVRAGGLSPPILKLGFRPFFLGGALFAAMAVGLWLGMLADVVSLPIVIDPLAWHQHEMLFGFTSAVIAGFLLTAFPSWTGRLPVNGAPLAAFFGIWLAGRLAQAFSAVIGGALAAGIDASFLVLLTALTAREIVLSKNRRNLVVVGLISLLAIANILFHLGQLADFALGDVGLRLAMAAIAMLVALIGGRIVPSFTRNWLVKQDSQSLPAPFGRLDQSALLMLAAALFGFIVAPDALPTHLLLAIAGALLLVRLCRWRALSTWREPLVWSLHAGYLCIAVGVALLGFSALIPDLDRLSAIHALTAGGFGTMMLAVMTRASLGHSGRALAANRLTIAIYLLVMLGAAGRTVSSLMPGSLWLLAAGLVWASAFLLFAIAYGKLLCSPRQPSN